MRVHWKFGLLILMLMNSFVLFSQNAPFKQDSITWDINYKLKWSDFTGNEDASSSWMAGCAASIYVKGFRENGLPNFSVNNSFIKNEAWTKDTTSVKMLRHEQLHFDIAEVFTRKIRKAVDSLRQKDVKAVAVYSEKIQKLLKMRNETDNLYDEQTSHGINDNAQFDWSRKILKELEALNAYTMKFNHVK